MLEMPLIEEVKGLLEKVSSYQECKPLQSIGYKQVCQFIHGEIGEEELFDKILFATRQYAKRQCTWFKQVKEDCLYELETKIK